ncbi:MAG TPA: hypothetical protein DD733_04015 [Clostridiales bacterium]|nr:hypothetical protein [Eubacteriales bacterium]HBR31231.1 hypothetical protein [Clostridiales bacterium]
MFLDANILTYFKSKFLYKRIESIFSNDAGVRLLESSYINEFVTRIENLGSNISCVIIDDSADEKDVSSDIIAIRGALVKHIPILMISSGNNNSFFASAVKLGVDDIIIKPFTDSFLRERVIKLINNSRGKNVEIISIGLYKYIKGEFLKAKKGNFSLTIMLTSLKFANEDNFSQKEKIFFMDTYFNRLDSLFWDTDLFIKFNSKYYLGIFPFCDTRNANVIYKKSAQSFEELKATNIIPSDCEMVVTFVSYPDEFDSVDEGISKLIEKIRTSFFDYELEVFFSEN